MLSLEKNGSEIFYTDIRESSSSRYLEDSTSIDMLIDIPKEFRDIESIFFQYSEFFIYSNMYKYE